MASNLLLSNSIRTELPKVELESNRASGVESNFWTSCTIGVQWVVQRFFLCIKFCSETFCTKTTWIYFKTFQKNLNIFWNILKIGAFWLNFKFANSLSNFELLRTSIYGPYGTKTLTSRTKFEAIPNSKWNWHLVALVALDGRHVGPQLGRVHAARAGAVEVPVSLYVVPTANVAY